MMKPTVVLMIVSMALSVAIGFVIARGGAKPDAAAAKGDKVQIGFSMDTLKETRWQNDRDLFVARAGELGAETLVQSANSDDTHQMQDVRALLASKVSVLIIVPHDATTMAGAVDQAHAEGVPVIAYDRMIKDAPVDLYVSFDNLKVGELQAQFVLDQLKGKKGAKIVRIYGAPTDNNAKLFKEGQDRVIEPAVLRGDVKVVHEDWAEEWKPENGKKIVNAAITRAGRDIDAVLSSNDGLAGGAIQALTEEGLAGKVVVTGQDAELAAAQRIAAGTQAMTIYKPVKKLATMTADAAVKMAHGKPVVARASVNNGKNDVPALLSDVTVVTKDNLVDTIVKDGWLSYDDVFRGIPDGSRPPRPAAVANAKP